MQTEKLGKGPYQSARHEVAQAIQGVSSIRRGIFNKKCPQVDFLLGGPFSFKVPAIRRVVKKKKCVFLKREA